ncbi:MAG: hypothetical protein K9K67_03780 [Bacteriovoracaceae bacterium]|nr:hypothetical protein [Bacteriovoracaceae bacterium]
MMKHLLLLLIFLLSLSSHGFVEQFLARADVYELDGRLFRSNQLMVKTDKENNLLSLYEITFPGNGIDLLRLARRGDSKAKRMVTIARVSAKDFSSRDGGEIELIVPSLFAENNSIRPLKFKLLYSKEAQRWQIIKDQKVITTLNLYLNQNMEGATFFSMIFSPPKISSMIALGLSCQNQEQYLEDTNDQLSVENLNCD